MQRDEALKIAVSARNSFNEACMLAWRAGLVEPRGDVAERVYGYRHGWFFVADHAFNSADLDIAQYGSILQTYDVD